MDAERKVSSLFSGRKRSSGAGAHVTFKIGGGVNNEEFVVLQEKVDETDKLLDGKDQICESNEVELSFSTNSDSLSSELNAVSPDIPCLLSPIAERNVFVELYDLKLINEDEKRLNGSWNESARWVKYEEDVEGVDHRWGAPHIAFLSMASIFQLRKCVSKGIVLLDSKATTFPQLCEQIAKAMVNQGHCVVDTQRIIDILMLKHNHVPDRRISRISSIMFDRPPNDDPARPQRTHSAALLHNKNSISELKSQASPHLSACPTSPSNLLPSAADDFNYTSDHPLLNISSDKPSFDEDSMPVYPKISISSFVNRFRRNFSKPNLDEDDFVTRNLPLDTEAVQVFAGVIKELVKVRFVMARLETATFMPEIVERQIPVRFVFLILGPDLPNVHLHELGRTISTLIANKDFNASVYEAKSPNQLLSAIDRFLNASVIVPPGDIDNKRLLSGDEIKKALKRCTQGMSKQNENLGDKSQQNGTSNGVSPITDGQNAKKARFRFFGGMMNDLSKRYPQYKSDILDAFNFQCLTSIVFMFFASFAPAITFGGLLDKYTDGKIGLIETLFAQCFCGVLWGLFSCQPLIIMSATGPVLIFEASLYATCKALGLDFLVIRLYAGIWILLIAIVISSVDGAKLLKYVTRFTEDIFSSLISAIFISESFNFVWNTFIENPVENFIYYERVHSNCVNASGFSLPNLTFAPTRTFPNITNILKQNLSVIAKRATDKNQPSVPLTAISNASTVSSVPCVMAEPNTALLTAIILFSTFTLAFSLKKLRESFYLGRHLRRAIGDFGVLIAIAIVVSIVQIWIPDPYLQRLDMPDHLNFTNPEARGHGLLVMISLEKLSQNWYGIFVALIAALLVFVLLFVETEITELLLLRKEKGCRKQGGMNFDLILLGVCTLTCSIFGLPWMCAAVLQSLSHASSLTVFKKKPPGSKAEVDYVIEQRLTAIVVSLLIGLISFAGSYLRLPMASLFGVFLYLGIMNLYGVQLIERIVLFFIPEKYFPQRAYTQEVSFWRMNLYTFIQIILLVFIFIVKNSKKTALAFPFVLIIFIAFRHFIMPILFTQKELKALDGDEETDDLDEWEKSDMYHVRIPV